MTGRLKLILLPPPMSKHGALKGFSAFLSYTDIAVDVFGMGLPMILPGVSKEQNGAEIHAFKAYASLL